MSEDIDKHVAKKYEVLQKLGKGEEYPLGRHTSGLALRSHDPYPLFTSPSGRRLLNVVLFRHVFVWRFAPTCVFPRFRASRPAACT